MDSTNMESLMERLQKIKEEQKSLADQEANVKSLISNWLEGNWLDDKYESEHCTVRLQSRSKKTMDQSFAPKRPS